MTTNGLSFSERVLTEFEQCADEGRDVSGFEDEARLINDAFAIGQLMENEAKHLLEKMRRAPIRKDYPYYEPSDLKGIKASRPKAGNFRALVPDWDVYYDKVYGAWLGRCIGCLLGMPVESWSRKRLIGFLKDTDNYPVTKYLSSDVSEEIRKRYSVVDIDNNTWSPQVRWINLAPPYGPEDDDTNYTVLYLKLFEEKGKDFTSEDAAKYWLSYLPALKVFSAQRIAYQNIMNLINPPLSAYYFNPYRERIGGHIRADFFGYAAPGNPELAAELAFKDGRLSMVKNGLYAEMYCAALLAKAAVSNDMIDIIEHGLKEIPENSRLTIGIKKVLEWFRQGISWEDAIERLNTIYDDNNPHQRLHATANAMICAISLLWGEGDFGKTIGYAVTAAFDTDCNGATAGSIVGMILGAKKIPEYWRAPLNNRLQTGITGFEMIEISELAKRTVAVAKKIIGG